MVAFSSCCALMALAAGLVVFAAPPGVTWHEAQSSATHAPTLPDTFDPPGDALR